MQGTEAKCLDRPNKLYIWFLVPHPNPLTASHVPCAHAQLNYIAVTIWMYSIYTVSSVATRDYITSN